MKTTAGLVQFDLPDGWRDQTRYVFRSRDEELEITLSYSPVGPDASPNDLLDPIELKLKANAFDGGLVRDTRKIAGLPCSTLVTRAKGKNDDEETVMHVVTFIPQRGQGATLTATTTARYEAKLKAAVKEVIDSMSLLPTK